jgi:hypothetical protein
MTDTKNHSKEGVAGSLEGRVFQPASFAELAEAVELAFDYRGDVTVSLKSGESLFGYLFNRQVSFLPTVLRRGAFATTRLPRLHSPARTRLRGNPGKPGSPRKIQSGELKWNVSQPRQKHEEFCKFSTCRSHLCFSFPPTQARREQFSPSL